MSFFFGGRAFWRICWHFPHLVRDPNIRNELDNGATVVMLSAVFKITTITIKGVRTYKKHKTTKINILNAMALL